MVTLRQCMKQILCVCYNGLQISAIITLSFILPIQGSIELDRELEKFKFNWVYLVMVQHDSRFQLMVTRERRVITEVTTLWEGLKSLIGAYFTFNIEYPRQLRALMIFTQHRIFHVKDAQNTPNVVKQVKSTLDKIHVEV